MNAIFLPSGDQLGYSLIPAIAVICTGSEPSAFITQMSLPLLPLRSEAKAIRSPVGLNVGMMSLAESLVISITVVPPIFCR